MVYSRFTVYLSSVCVTLGSKMTQFFFQAPYAYALQQIVIGRNLKMDFSDRIRLIKGLFTL